MHMIVTILPVAFMIFIAVGIIYVINKIINK